jgi:hypothetical protein
LAHLEAAAKSKYPFCPLGLGIACAAHGAPARLSLTQPF